jgi:hypothetical protein
LNGSGKGRLVVDGVIAVVIVLALIDMQSIPEKARFMPQLVAWATLALVVLPIALHLFPALQRWAAFATPRSDDISSQQAEPPGEWPRALLVITYILAFWLLVFLFGFYLVPPVAITLYLVTEGKVRIHRAVLAALIATALMLFGMDVLGVGVWTGAGPELIRGYVGGEVMPLF